MRIQVKKTLTQNMTLIDRQVHDDGTNNMGLFHKRMQRWLRWRQLINAYYELT